MFISWSVYSWPGASFFFFFFWLWKIPDPFISLPRTYVWFPSTIKWNVCDDVTPYINIYSRCPSSVQRIHQKLAPFHTRAHGIIVRFRIFQRPLVKHDTVIKVHGSFFFPQQLSLGVICLLSARISLFVHA